MNQLEEFQNYYIQQTKEDENQTIYDEPKEGEIFEQPQEEINSVKNEEETKKKKVNKESTSKRLKSLPKKYQTYTMGYKRQIVEMVIKTKINFY